MGGGRRGRLDAVEATPGPDSDAMPGDTDSVTCRLVGRAWSERG